MSRRTPLGRVLGLGSAHEGTEHWWAQRVSAIALVPLTLWFVIAVSSMPSFNYGMLHIWLGDPIDAFGSILLVATLSFHSYLGTRVVIEDYVHGPAAKIGALLVLRFAHVIVGGAAIFAIAKIVLGTPSP